MGAPSNARALAGILLLLSTTSCRPSERTTPDRANRSVLAFTMQVGGQWDLFTVESEGGDPIQITDTPEREIRPVWSPDGRHLAFSHGEVQGPGVLLGTEDLFVLDIEDRQVRRVAQGPVFGWAWSPDSTLISYSTLQSQIDCYYDGFTLHVIRARDGEEVAAEKDGWDPVWVGDESKLLFFKQDEDLLFGEPQLRELSPDGTVRPFPPPSREYRLVPVTASPDGALIYWVNLIDEQLQPEWLWSTSAQGTQLERIAMISGANGIQFSRIIVSDYAGCSSHRDVMRAWSPDGTRLALLWTEELTEPADPLNLPLDPLNVGILEAGTKQPVAVLPYRILMAPVMTSPPPPGSAHPDVESDFGIVSVTWSPDGAELFYAVQELPYAETQTDRWHFLSYSLPDGPPVEMLANADPEEKAFLACCGLAGSPL